MQTHTHTHTHTTYFPQCITTPNLLKLNKINPVESTHSIAFTLHPISAFTTTSQSIHNLAQPKSTNTYYMHLQAVENSKADCFQYFGDVGFLSSEAFHVPRTYSEYVLPFLCWHQRVGPVQRWSATSDQLVRVRWQPIVPWLRPNSRRSGTVLRVFTVTASHGEASIDNNGVRKSQLDSTQV